MSPLTQLANRKTIHKVGSLAFGTLGSQLLIVGTMPILTRLYSPDAFGAYGIFLAIVGVASVFSTFRYERGIVVARDIGAKHSLFVLTLLIAASSTPLIYALFLLWGGYGPSGESSVRQVIIMMPALLAVAIGLLGIESAFRYLALKQQAYRVLGLAQATRSAIQAGLQIVFAFTATLSSYGLIVGATVAPGVVALMLLSRQRREKWIDFEQTPVTLNSVRKAAKDNSEYPKYMVWAALCNSLTNHALVLLIGALFSVTAAGAIFLAYRVLMMPTKLLAKNISLVNLQEASELSGERMSRLYKRRVGSMLVIGSGPLALTVVVAPWIFPLVFGPEWREAGVIAQALAPAVYLQFVFMSFLTLFTALRAQRAYLAWSAGRFLLTVTCLFAGARFGDLYGAVIGFGVALMVSYLAAHVLLLNRLNVSEREIFPS